MHRVQWINEEAYWCIGFVDSLKDYVKRLNSIDGHTLMFLAGIELIVGDLTHQLEDEAKKHIACRKRKECPKEEKDIIKYFSDSDILDSIIQSMDSEHTSFTELKKVITCIY